MRNVIRVYETMGRGPNVSFSTTLLGWFVAAPIATGILMLPLHFVRRGIA